MNIINRIFGHADSPRGGQRRPGPNHDMRQVLQAYLDLEPKPLETLTPAEARAQPTMTDAVIKLLRQEGELRQADLAVITEDIVYAGAASGLPARIYRKQVSEKLHPVVVYFHGGGWVIGDIDTYDAGPRAIAKYGDVIVVSCHYRQAPEHPFPAAHEDALAAYQWVLDNAESFGGDPARVAVMGESAGANLAAGVAMMSRDLGIKTPVHMALIYPVAGVDMDTVSYRENANAIPLGKAGMEWFVSQVFKAKGALQDPRINLVEADLRGMPPATIVCAGIDPLRSEGELLAERLEAQGVTVKQKTYDGVTHEFFGMGLVVQEADAAEHFVAHQLKHAFSVPFILI
ncbi:alpha/beta hydrolase [soil metagenome]